MLPRVKPMTAVRIKLPSARKMVTGNAGLMASDTGSVVTNDRPKSPCSASFAHRRY
jgi:hypothetical protein